eukprot:SAG31_NODE_692_length_12772_cov_15.543044_4_plen_332_part_00
MDDATSACFGGGRRAQSGDLEAGAFAGRRCVRHGIVQRLCAAASWAQTGAQPISKRDVIAWEPNIKPRSIGSVLLSLMFITCLPLQIFCTSSALTFDLRCRLPPSCSAECAEAFVSLAQDCYERAGLASVDGVDAFVAECETVLADSQAGDGTVSAAALQHLRAEMRTEMQQLRTEMQHRIDSLEASRGTSSGAHGSASAETSACTCSLCAVPPEMPGHCIPWTADPNWQTYSPALEALPEGRGVEAPCDCQAPQDSSAQPFPVQAEGSPPCCRLEWQALATTTAISDGSNTHYDQPEVNIMVGGKVTFVYSGPIGFENVQQVGRAWRACI